MKKIGILNFQYMNHNYGAVLQAASLEHTCRQLGHEPKHLDYVPNPKVTLKNKIGKLLRKLGLIKTSKANQVANETAFERFRLNFINRTQRIKSCNEFTEVAKNFDSIIVGSDQVWRPEFAKDPIGFFLGYVPKGVDRIAYAASFGTTNWQMANDVVLTNKVREELNRFKAISCREESGVKICKEIFGVEAIHVLDPLLLVDDSFFEKVLARALVKPSAKLVYYKLDSSHEFLEDLNKISFEIGSKATDAYSSCSEIHKYREVSDWLNMILNAEVVITDSFHCICLALRFGKKVIYCTNNIRGKTRLDSLFKQLNIHTEPLRFDLKTEMYSLKNNGDVTNILKRKGHDSINFLKTALSEY